MGDITTHLSDEGVSLSSDPPLGEGNTSQSGEDSITLTELMAVCTTLKTQMEEMQRTIKAQQLEIDDLKAKVSDLSQSSHSRKIRRVVIDSPTHLQEDAVKKGEDIPRSVDEEMEEVDRGFGLNEFSDAQKVTQIISGVITSLGLGSEINISVGEFDIGVKGYSSDNTGAMDTAAVAVSTGDVIITDDRFIISTGSIVPTVSPFVQSDDEEIIMVFTGEKEEGMKAIDTESTVVTTTSEQATILQDDSQTIAEALMQLSGQKRKATPVKKSVIKGVSIKEPVVPKRKVLKDVKGKGKGKMVEEEQESDSDEDIRFLTVQEQIEFDEKLANELIQKEKEEYEVMNEAERKRVDAETKVLVEQELEEKAKYEAFYAVTVEKEEFSSIDELLERKRKAVYDRC